MTLSGKRALLIIGGGIAAYKCLDLIRRLRERGAKVRTILTAAGEAFVTPLSLAALSEDKVYRSLFDLTDEAEMGHIQLSRDANLLVVAPATANLIARMAGGLADDLATTALLATDKPVLIAPAMNVRMWEHPATRRNLEQLRRDGIHMVGPNEGDMACGEYGYGRMAEPAEIIDAIQSVLAAGDDMRGLRALVTSGPTREAIDPVRYIANHSSGKQGHAIAAALARHGAETILVSGPTGEADPAGVRVVRIASAAEMLNACQNALPADIAICAAAVADWRPEPTPQKIKKKGKTPPPIKLVENPDILKTLSRLQKGRPRLVVGFAAETENLLANAKAKRAAKGCDWIVANSVAPAVGTFGGENNTVHLITGEAVEDWPPMSKRAVADRLAERIAAYFGAGRS